MKKTLALLVKKAPFVLKLCFGAFFSAVLVLLLFVDKRVDYVTSQSEVLLSNASLSLFALPLALLCAFFVRRRVKIRPAAPSLERRARGTYLLAGMFFAALYALQLFIAKNIYFYGGWDFGMLLDSARSVALEGASGVDRWYFGMYPNNLTAVYLLAWLYRLGAVLTPREPYAVVLAATSLLVNLSVCMATLCVFKRTSSRLATVVTMLAGAFLVALSPWIVIPYTDALSMIFPASALFFSCFLKGRRLKSFLVALVLTFGAFLKPTVLLLLAAFAAAALVCALGDPPALKRYAAGALFALLAVLFAFSLRYALLLENKTELAGELRMPFTHFLMMGLNRERNGVYSEEDVVFSAAFPNVKTRQAANLSVIKTRLFAPGLLALFMKKALCSFNDGTFAWGMEGNFYRGVPPAKTDAALALRKLFYNHTPEHAVLATAQQGVWLFLLFCALGCARPSAKMGLPERAAMLALLGVSVFLLLFECRARYLYLFSPLFLMLAGCALAGGVPDSR